MSAAGTCRIGLIRHPGLGRMYCEPVRSRNEAMPTGGRSVSMFCRPTARAASTTPAKPGVAMS